MVSAKYWERGLLNEAVVPEHQAPPGSPNTCSNCASYALTQNKCASSSRLASLLSTDAPVPRYDRLVLQFPFLRSELIFIFPTTALHAKINTSPRVPCCSEHVFVVPSVSRARRCRRHLPPGARPLPLEFSDPPQTSSWTAACWESCLPPGTSTAGAAPSPRAATLSPSTTRPPPPTTTT